MHQGWIAPAGPVIIRNAIRLFIISKEGFNVIITSISMYWDYYGRSHYNNTVLYIFLEYRVPKWDDDGKF